MSGTSRVQSGCLWVQLTLSRVAGLGGLLEGDHCSRRIQAFYSLVESSEPKFWQKGADLKGLDADPRDVASQAVISSTPILIDHNPPSPHSIIQGINQDRFIQRAVEASNAYSSILQAVEAAEDAAGQALQQASRTWEVSPEHLWLPGALLPSPSGGNSPV